MRKAKLFEKRVLALALSVSMVFVSTDTYVALAAEAEDVGEAADIGFLVDETEVTAEDSTEDLDPADSS